MTSQLGRSVRDRLGRELPPDPPIDPDRVEQAKRDFLAAAHHMDAPVSAMTGIADLLRDRSRASSAVMRNQLIEMLAIHAGETAAIVRNLVMSARLDIGELALSREAVELRTVVEGVTAAWSTNRRTRLTVTGNAVTIGDEEAVSMIFGNLLGHAAATGAANVTVQITRSVKRVTVDITHDGDAIDPMLVGSLFEPYNVHRGRDGSPAFTLGLSVARRLAREMLGEVTFRADGESSVFELTLPSAMGEGATRRGQLIVDPTSGRPSRSTIAQLLADKAVEMAYQPVEHLATHAAGTDSVIGYEALARFPNATPPEWFDLAGKEGLRLDLELAAIEAAVAGFVPQRPAAFLAVYLSDGTLTSSRIYDALAGVDPGRVVLELSEVAVIRSYEITNRAVGALTERGCRLAIDDVGSGEVDFWHVLRLDPSVIKVDMTLVRGIEADHRNAALIRAITAMSGDLGIMVIAEGVETDRERDRLVELGVEYGQGYLLGRPQPLRWQTRFLS